MMLPLRRVLKGKSVYNAWKIKTVLVLIFSENKKQDLDTWPLLQDNKGQQ
jgi:hypothetical protein